MTKVTSGEPTRTMAPDVHAVSMSYYAALDCPRSLTAALLLRHGEYDQLASLKATPKDYNSAREYHKAASASDWLRKYPGLPVKADPEYAALESWIQSEVECEITNDRIAAASDHARTRAERRDDVPTCVDELALLDDFLDLAGDFFCRVLGAVPDDLTPRFGPGATASDPATHTTVLDKVSSKLTVTEGCMCMFALWHGTAWERSLTFRDGYYKPKGVPRIVEGNTYFTVPKTALIHRACAKGPSVNVAYQLPVGLVLRERLLTFCNMDLVSGQSRHQEMARKGSLTGDYATLDSERASDTMALMLVRRLCKKSPDWLELLESLREPVTQVYGQRWELNKFSAMGNGYTFELETLVFLSLAWATAHLELASGRNVGPSGARTALDLIKLGDISVFGDDVVVPSTIANDVARNLQACGFTVNLKKSFFDGEFRESCGGDFYNGVAVQTAKLTKEVDDVAGWFSVHNVIKARSVDTGLVNKRLLIKVKDQIPRRFRKMYGPTWLGDQVLHGWYGPQITQYARVVETGLHGPVQPGVAPLDRREDPNQLVGSLEVLTPVKELADLSDYTQMAQLAYHLYSYKSEAPVRRPTRKLKYVITRHEEDYHVLFMTKPPRAPLWLATGRSARNLGLVPSGASVG